MGTHNGEVLQAITLPFQNTIMIRRIVEQELHFNKDLLETRQGILLVPLMDHQGHQGVVINLHVGRILDVGPRPHSGMFFEV
jgi:hypothetical protein